MFRDRVKELRRVKARDLIPHALNFRTHPADQRSTLSAMLDDVGIAGTLIAYETPEGLHLIDGHLRTDMDPDAEWPVIVLDVDEHEALKLLATYDRLSALAETDAAKLDELLSQVQFDDPDVRKMLDELAVEAGIRSDEIEPAAEEPLPELPAVPITKPGDLWILGSHRLLCGDATKAKDVKRLMAGSRADCIFTSPPYGVGVDYGATYEDSIANLRAMLPKLAKRWREIVVDGEHSSASGWFDSTAEGPLEVGKDEHGGGMAVTVAIRMLAIHSREQSVVVEPFCGTGTLLRVRTLAGLLRHDDPALGVADREKSPR